MSESALPELICSACLYVRPRPGVDPAELTLLTIINGQLICLRHAPIASSSHHTTLKGAVMMESQGKLESLSAYQDWRRAQDRESGSENTDG